MSQHISTPRLPKLTKTNRPTWLYAVQCKGAALSVSAILSRVNYEYDPRLHRSEAALTGAILSSLLESTAAAIVSTHDNTNFASLIQQVRNKYHNTTDRKHFALGNQAGNLKITDFDDVEDFLRAHQKLQACIIATNYHEVADERAMMKRILRRLWCHNTFSKIIVHWSVNPKNTISEPESICKIVQTALGLNKASEDPNKSDKATSIWLAGSSRGKLEVWNGELQQPEGCRDWHTLQISRQLSLMTHRDKKCRDAQHPNIKNSSYTLKNKNSNG